MACLIHLTESKVLLHLISKQGTKLLGKLAPATYIRFALSTTAAVTAFLFFSQCPSHT